MKILLGCSLLLSLAAQADPTRPSANWVQQQQAGPLQLNTKLPTLQLIKLGANGNVAVIEGQFLQKGQFFNRYKIEDITADQVVLLLDGEPKILRLVNTAIKQNEQ